MDAERTVAALRKITRSILDARVRDEMKTTLLGKLAVLEAQPQADRRDLLRPRELQWHWMMALATARKSQLMDAILENEQAFATVDGWIWSDSASFSVKRLEDLEVDELFSYLAEKAWRSRTPKSRDVLEFYFDLRTLQEQARRVRYQRIQPDVRAAWRRILKFRLLNDFFAEFRGMAMLREKLRGFLRGS